MIFHPSRRSVRDIALLALAIGLLVLPVMAAIHTALSTRAGAEDLGKWPAVTPIPARSVSAEES